MKAREEGGGGGVVQRFHWLIRTELAEQLQSEGEEGGLVLEGEGRIQEPRI